MAAAAPLILSERGGRGGVGRQEATGVPRLAVVGGDGSAGSRPDPMTVLVVEDDPAMQILIVYNLEAEGFRVVAASTGTEAIGLAASEEPDVVLLDVMLPDLGGFEVAQKLRPLPVVFVSARVSEKDLERGREVGAIDYVTKPFDPLELPGRVREDLEEFERGGAERVWTLRFGPGSDGND
jgi:DNA-binding response OmpR family regulator